MIMLEFYRRKKEQIEKEIVNCELKRDFKSMVKLRVKKDDIEKRIKEIENYQIH